MSESKVRINPYPLIKDTTPPVPRIDPDAVAKALGAEPMYLHRPPTGSPIVLYVTRDRLLTPAEQLSENRVVLSSQDVDKLASIVRAKQPLSNAASPAQVLNAFLRLTLAEHPVS